MYDLTYIHDFFLKNLVYHKIWIFRFWHF